jgi:hypothetical protein
MPKTSGSNMESASKRLKNTPVNIENTPCKIKEPKKVSFEKNTNTIIPRQSSI